MKRILLATSFLALVSYAIWSYTTNGVVHLLFAPEIASQSRLEGIRDYFQSWGVAAPVGYMLLVTFEVILAPIPGTILYLPGGAIFGWWLGGLMALLGNTIGAGAACQIMRTLGRSYLDRYLEGAAVKKYQHVLELKGLWIICLLRINPLTSSDLVSYAAGLTRLPVWKVMTGTALGMAPLCFVQSYFAQAVLTSFPRLIYPLILIGVAWGIYVCVLLRRLGRN